MGYVTKNLMQEEQVIYMSKIHWAIFLTPVAWILASRVMASAAEAANTAEPASGDMVSIVSIVMLAWGIYGLLLALIYKWTTEMAVTSKRIIAKQGLIRRKTTELNHSKVESFAVDQSILGRILGYGTVTIQGTGGGKTPINGIDDPLAFRREAMQVIDTA